LLKMTVTLAMCGDQSSVFSSSADDHHHHSRHYRRGGGGGQFCETPESLNLVRRDSLMTSTSTTVGVTMSAKQGLSSSTRRKDSAAGVSDGQERVVMSNKVTTDDEEEPAPVGGAVNASSDEDLPGASHVNNNKNKDAVGRVPALAARTNAKGKMTHSTDVPNGELKNIVSETSPGSLNPRITTRLL
jgi:hypothetical protein